jgi:hypothetical protein
LRQKRGNKNKSMARKKSSLKNEEENARRERRKNK